MTAIIFNEIKLHKLLDLQEEQNIIDIIEYATKIIED